MKLYFCWLVEAVEARLPPNVTGIKRRKLLAMGSAIERWGTDLNAERGIIADYLTGDLRKVRH